MPAFSAQERNSSHVAQPPGGRGSFIFDDSISRGAGGDVPHRHTNGLRRLENPSMGTEPTGLRQPPGGRSGFRLDDNSTGSYDRAPSAAAQAPRQPPGGRSGFTLTDGSNDALSELVESQSRPQSHMRSSHPGGHGPMVHDYAQPPSAAPPMQAFAPSAMPPLPCHRHNPPDAHPPAGRRDDAHFLFGTRRSQMAPPGGHTSFSLGWGGDNSGNHHGHAGRYVTRPMMTGNRAEPTQPFMPSQPS